MMEDDAFDGVCSDADTVLLRDGDGVGVRDGVGDRVFDFDFDFDLEDTETFGDI
jgi:hypothetical protein